MYQQNLAHAIDVLCCHREELDIGKCSQYTSGTPIQKASLSALVSGPDFATSHRVLQPASRLPASVDGRPVSSAAVLYLRLTHTVAML